MNIESARQSLELSYILSCLSIELQEILLGKCSIEGDTLNIRVEGSHTDAANLRVAINFELTATLREPGCKSRHPIKNVRYLAGDKQVSILPIDLKQARKKPAPTDFRQGRKKR